LGLYWVFPVLLITDVWGPRAAPSPPVLGVAIAVHTLGVVVMMAADTQKYFTLKYRRGLIDEGWFARVRHANYTGEMMIYGAYALLASHWIAWAILAWVWGGVFAANIAMKEASLARYPGWADYRRRSGLLVPGGLGSARRFRRSRESRANR
jgi:protein-S-isoprenylcysteine O-methyltransferase Ste14